MPNQPKSPVRIETIHDFYSFNLGRTRAVDVYLPPDYALSRHRYRVLYANDGQDMARLDLTATLNGLYARDRMEPIIVVAIHATVDRLIEYGTIGTPNARRLGRRAAAYAGFLMDEVRPYINRRYRTLTDASDTAILGLSLGGLSAFDIAWHHADAFGAVGVFSGSFWWRTDDAGWRAQQASRIAHQLVRASQRRSGLRFWFEVGTADETADRDGNGVIDTVQDTTELIDELAAIGYRRGKDVVLIEVKEGRHDHATWAKVLPHFLQWAFPPRRSFLAKFVMNLRRPGWSK